MRLSATTRLVLILTGSIVTLAGLLIWATETEYGGNDAIAGYEIGYLPSDTAEVREIAWTGLEPGQSGTYEVRSMESPGIYELASIDGEPGTKGGLPITGTYAEITQYLDEQGPVAFFGPRSEVLLWMDRQRQNNRDYATAALVIGLGAVLIIAGGIPTWSEERRDRTDDTTVLIT